MIAFAATDMHALRKTRTPNGHTPIYSWIPSQILTLWSEKADRRWFWAQQISAGLTLYLKYHVKWPGRGAPIVQVEQFVLIEVKITPPPADTTLFGNARWNPTNDGRATAIGNRPSDAIPGSPPTFSWAVRLYSTSRSALN